MQVRELALVEYPGLSRATRHAVTLSLCVEDPDGITVELFVDRDPALYRDTSGYLGAPTAPLSL